MLTKEIKELTLRLDDVEKRFEDIGSNENLESEIYEIERKVSEYLELAESIHFSQLKKLQKRISQLKENNDFYDEDAELDMMFPNRHDDDFDEDSMSYDSVFGED